MNKEDLDLISLSDIIDELENRLGSSGWVMAYVDPDNNPKENLVKTNFGDKDTLTEIALCDILKRDVMDSLED